MTAVDRLRVHAIQLAHARGEIGFNRFHHDVIVIRHLAPRVAHPIKAAADPAEGFKPCTPIGLIEVNIFPPVATRSDPLDRGRAQGGAQAGIVAQQ